jgi:uncharacterized membrane protein (DUF373 family)
VTEDPEATEATEATEDPEDTEDTNRVVSADESVSGRVAELTDRFVEAVELVAAAVFAGLFAIGVLDLTLNIGESVENGTITDPQRVIDFIDTGLLLLIIVEVYQTVVAYTQESNTKQIVRLVIYTGVIAMVRKVIIFRTGEYPTETDALVAASAYTLIIFALVGLLLAERASKRIPL